MTLPNLSHMVYVGQLRHIQSAYESPEHRNPDELIHHFLSRSQLWSCRLRGRLALDRLRRNPFYYYILARTKHYDSVFSTAIADGVRHILNIGCGSDTRAYRYADQLREARISCLECDQEKAIFSKEKMARQKLKAGHVQYMPIDLNVASWAGIDDWLARRQHEKVLVMMEGVSPYIDERTFIAFLQLLASRLSSGSRLAYDFKRKGVADDFGRAETVPVPFRLPGDRAEVHRFHRELGLSVDEFELDNDLVARTVPGINGSKGKMFSEDALVQLSVIQGIK
ncbi:class I SAM-dependent methyltransferase [Sphaerotilaceae bacterium SBD11-9]